MRAFFAIVCVTVSTFAQAKPIEIWECQQTIYGNWNNILVVATVEDGRLTGTIAVAGVTHKASFAVEGFDRRWDFGPKVGVNKRYAFVVRPNGQAGYYEFSGEKEGKLSNEFFCRQRAQE